LGLPFTTKRIDKSFFMTLIEKIEKKIGRLEREMLTRGGRMQLIKTVISAITIYFLWTGQIVEHGVSLYKRARIMVRTFEHLTNYNEK
jgi:hypothetical protein